MKQRTLSSLAALLFSLSAMFVAIAMTPTALNAGTITGFVWNDLNTNGIQDPGEPGMEDIWVLLLDAGGNQLDGRLTDANGIYTFNDVPAGTYILRFSNPGGIWQTPQNQGNDDSIDSDADPLGYTDVFTIAQGQVVKLDAGFTSEPQGCFTPVIITVSAIECNDNGTPDPDDDTFTFAITASGGTGPWGWDLLPDLMMVPYDTAITFGPFQIVNGAITLTIVDHDNPDCIATVTVNPPAPCSSPTPPSGDTLVINCPPDLTTVATGSTGTNVTFNAPVATTTCPSGATVTQISGPTSGSQFPVGTTEVCFAATDTCGNADTCCFKVIVNTAPPTPTNCDEKIIGCIKYELLDITLDANKNRTYRIRVTNNCASKMVYTAFQLPNGIVAKAPANNSIYTAPSGREYAVRNPNFSPFYSIRFMSSGPDSISNGQSDIFSYTLPPQIAPDYIHVIVRVTPKVFYEAHLNTFDCVPIVNATSPGQVDKQHYADATQLDDGAEAQNDATQALPDAPLKVYPNPSAGSLSVDLSPWKGQSVKVLLMNGQGNAISILNTEANNAPFSFDVAGDLPKGLYFIQVVPSQGNRKVQQFILQR
ncbi:MAG: HYR domain-containing protein [Saprospiraceae bacterium]|nr:HYR domain-containing protein [Saprospiraceae bacterium]